jgi:hypothetical protein
MNREIPQDLISLPLNRESCPNFLVIQYLDDTLVLMKENRPQPICLKEILHTFVEST